MNLPPALFARFAKSPTAFRDDLRVDVDGIVKKFGDVIEPWQRTDFEALDAGMMRCNGQSESPDAVMRAYLERARGHSKTTDLAIICCWIMAFAKRPLRGYAFAADRDQAGLLKDAMDRLCRLNPWLGSILEIQKGLVVNVANKHPGNGSTLEIFASNVATSYGILPDFIICDELTHWEGDGSLWHSILSSAAKRSNCLLAVISNAGFTTSWQWEVREAARLDDGWYFSRLDGPVASWMTEARLAEQRKMLPHIAYSRLWLNEWSSGGGDALTEETIDAAFIEGLSPETSKHPDWLYAGGLDLGLTRDCASFVVLAVPAGGRAGKIKMVHHKLWRPTLGQKINLLAVQSHLIEMDNKFGLEFIAFDPWQAEHLAQTIEADMGRKRRSERLFIGEPFMRELPPTATNLRAQATLTIEFFNDRRVQLFDCQPLRRDLKKLRVEEKSYGVRLVSPRDGEGHGDSFSAFALALVVANELGGKPVITVGPGLDSLNQSGDWGFSQRVREWEEEQRRLMEPDDDPTGFKEACRTGRLYSSRDFER